MNEATENPAEIYSIPLRPFLFPINISLLHFSFHLKKRLKDNIVNLNKKRKLQAEQLDLPKPKHKFCARSFACEPVSVFETNPGVESIFTNIKTEKAEGAAMDDESEPESAKDSSSFGVESDPAMSPYATENLFEGPSPSSGNFDSGDLKDTDHSSGFRKDNLAFLIGERSTLHDGSRAFQNLDENLLEFSNEVDYSCSEHGNDSFEQLTDKDIEDVLYSNGINPNKYVLSSGRWTVNQEAPSGTRKPTIDQEFEQYFSKLML
ncbi:protein FAR-RED-ELONGATED HYPOCOTYL 1-LIKE-like isoform X1 [Juglans regia]|uniref:Protein FAR-RED-ELONGATED HYPOCOTYL 1-LIKE-like isoform X1 n=1 Tax=Juglans regia TaxID=51240 RepID=A0A6P9EC06_JUGRE|nr:protein FAR-RED-ELONGATED HYPOCOTYL 1-LIKE-like isoform X1 [Juglans regia]